MAGVVMEPEAECVEDAVGVKALDALEDTDEPDD